MTVFGRIAQAWGPDMNAADRVRVVLAFSFVFGALSHVAWVIGHGDVWYRGPAPEWAPLFWYGLCLVDLVVCWLILMRPKPGLVMGAVTMAVSVSVNWTQFPTFEFLPFNYVLIGLTLFGVIYFCVLPWVWRASRWRLTASSAHSGG